MTITIMSVSDLRLNYLITSSGFSEVVVTISAFQTKQGQQMLSVDDVKFAHG